MLACHINYIDKLPKEAGDVVRILVDRGWVVTDDSLTMGATYMCYTLDDKPLGERETVYINPGGLVELLI